MASITINGSTFDLDKDIKLHMHVSRNEEGRIVIGLATHDFAEKDQFQNGVPKIALLLNDSYEELQEDGTWVES